MSRRSRRLSLFVPTVAPKLRVLFVASEVAPFSRTGGLAEVVAALPRALKHLAVEVLVVAPRYGHLDYGAGLAKRLSRPEVRFSAGVETAEVWEGRTPTGVRVLLLDHPGFFGRESLYGDSDDPARFTFLTLAALDLVKKMGWRPDVVHFHDWQTALGPYLMKRAKDPFFADTKSLLTVHNLGYQGLFPKSWVEWLGIGWEGFHIGGFEFYDQLSFLKGGIAYADWITTVSPRYAQEIQTPAGGFQLDGLLRSRADHLSGILNGLDYEEWDPRTDQALAQNFGPTDFHGRRRCKADLQRRYRLPIREGRPVIGLVSRLTHQKGLDLVVNSCERILSLGFQVTVLSSGDEGGLKGRLEQLAVQYPDLVGVKTEFDDATARRIFGGADFLLVPSRYEPCGLTQLEALRYGAVPVVHAVGGLVDTVEEADQTGAQGTGFLFSPHEEEPMLSALRRALSAYADNRAFRLLQQRGMTRDFSWKASARLYRDLYFRLAGRPIPADPEPNKGEVKVETLSGERQ
jgi:starch synthase